MIRPPIKPWTPPIHIITPSAPANDTESNTNLQSSSGSGSGSHSSSQTPIPTLESLFQEMLQHYLPETVEFTPLSEEVLSETIGNWLRPAYEQAIQSRREQTQRINAELDADAWSRGMGQSTYLSDVKERQYRGESLDVDALESDYASTLAGHLYDAMKAQQDKKIEVDEFNAEQINHANELAMQAAQALYNAYLTSHRSGGSGSGGAGGAQTSVSFADALLNNAAGNVNNVDYDTASALVGRMTPEERSRLYDRSDPYYLKLRSELLYGLGRSGLAALMNQYPGA